MLTCSTVFVQIKWMGKEVPFTPWLLLPSIGGLLFFPCKIQKKNKIQIWGAQSNALQCIEEEQRCEQGLLKKLRLNLLPTSNSNVSFSLALLTDDRNTKNTNTWHTRHLVLSKYILTQKGPILWPRYKTDDLLMKNLARRNMFQVSPRFWHN